jgi:hypothetical protein
MTKPIHMNNQYITASAARMAASWLVLSALIAGCAVDSPVEPIPTSSPVAAFGAEVPLAWSELQMQLIATTPGFTPPVAARALGYTGVTLYEALQPGMTHYRTLVGVVNGLVTVPSPEPNEAMDWPSVANGAMAEITRLLFASASVANAARIDSLENAIDDARRLVGDTTRVAGSIAHGHAVADAIFEWSRSDGGHEGYLRNFPAEYVPPVGPGMWTPTPRPGATPLRAMQPYWGMNRPFVLVPGNPSIDSDPGAPSMYSTDTASQCYRTAHEVYTTVMGLTPEQRAIALFWSDDPGATCTPAGHSTSILLQCVRSRHASLEAAAEAYARVGIAVSDAFVACWQMKYKYNVLRPITYIRDVIDSTWNVASFTDPLVTPPFPEYPSGHSVQSGAASVVLGALFGESFSFTDRTHDARGLSPRSFTSFASFADEAALSRLYGGIHFRPAIERGLVQGRVIGAKVAALRLRTD